MRFREPIDSSPRSTGQRCDGLFRFRLPPKARTRFARTVETVRARPGGRDESASPVEAPPPSQAGEPEGSPARLRAGWISFEGGD